MGTGRAGFNALRQGGGAKRLRIKLISMKFIATPQIWKTMETVNEAGRQKSNSLNDMQSNTTSITLQHKSIN